MRFSRHLKWLLPLVVILVGALIAYRFVISKPTPPSRPVTEKVWSVQSITAEPGVHRPNLILYGRVETPRMTNVTAAVTAFVKEVHTDAGDSIIPGDLLVELDDSDNQLLLTQRRAELSNLEAQLAAEQVRHEADLKALKIEQNLQRLSLKAVRRVENLIKRKVSSQDQLDNANRDYQQQTLALTQRQQTIADHPNRQSQIQARIDSAKSLLQAAELDQARTQISAPFKGRIVNLEVAPGDRVRAGDSILQMYSLDRLEVRSQVPNRVLPQLRNNSNEPLDIQAYANIDGQFLQLEFDRAAAAVDDARAGIDAFFRIASDGYLPEPGRSLSVHVQLPAVNDAIPVPPTALYGLNRVYTIDDERLRSITVERLGDALDAEGQPIVLIKSPEISSGMLIVTTQLPNAITGLKVKEVNNDV